MQHGTLRLAHALKSRNRWFGDRERPDGIEPDHSPGKIRLKIGLAHTLLSQRASVLLGLTLALADRSFAARCLYCQAFLLSIIKKKPKENAAVGVPKQHGWGAVDSRLRAKQSQEHNAFKVDSNVKCGLE
jgi:hypothetical protein